MKSSINPNSVEKYDLYHLRHYSPVINDAFEQIDLLDTHLFEDLDSKYGPSES